MTTITEEYRAQNAQLHAERPDYGNKGNAWAQHVRDLARRMGTVDVLDYGCGKATLSKALEADDVAVRNYDPAIPEFAADPAPADLIVCTDVLEHIEPELVDATLDHIAGLTRMGVLLAIYCAPAAKNLPDGRNAHLSVHHPNWWIKKLADRWELIQVQISRPVLFVVGRKLVEAVQ